MDTAPNHKLNNFDFLRFLFAVFVVFSHSFGLTIGAMATGESADPLSVLTQGVVSFGNLAVVAFFAISGYLITMSWERRPQLGDFVRKRALRILPGFYVACAFSLALAPVAANGMLRGYWRTLITQSVLMDSLHHPALFSNSPFPGALNGSLWTIRYELWCYVLVAVLGLVSAYRYRSVVAGLFFLSLAGLLLQGRYGSVSHFAAIVPGSTLIGDFNDWPRLLAPFLAGMALYKFRDRVPLSGPLAAFAFIAFVTALFIRLPRGLLAVFVPTAFAYAMFFVAFWRRVPLTNFGKSRDLSYGIYIYAFPVQQVLVLAGIRSPWLLFLCAMPPILLLAELSWHFVEKPMLARKRPEALQAAADSPLTASVQVE